MRRLPRVSPWVCLLLPLLAGGALATGIERKQTVCTVTINSEDEREAFKRHLPPDKFDFVELVERGRPDWLASACRAQVQCDVLVISGHFDDGHQFYSDKLDSRDHLPVAEMERAACSAQCGGLFSRLKEVYLFGCNTLNAEALRSVSREAVRGLVRAGRSPADADALARALEARHGESNRDRMRVVFKDAPVIYGFSSKAPLGAHAGPLLERYFKAGGSTEVGQGRGSAALLGLFAPVSMKAAAGVGADDPQARHRDDVCRFTDDGQPAVERVRFVHAVMRREIAEVQLHLDRLDALTTALAEVPATGDFARAKEALGDDADARDRYLAVARDADQLATTLQMLTIAQRLGWLTADDARRELLAAVDARAQRGAIGAADVETVCKANARHELDATAATLTAHPIGTANAAVLACLGRADARLLALRGLTSRDERDALIAQVYLQHRPLDQAGDIRALTAEISRMPGGDGQVRALDALAALRIADRESLATLAALYPRARSASVQRAIAGVLIRADYRAIATPELVRALKQHRVASPGGEDVIDVLIRRLQPES